MIDKTIKDYRLIADGEVKCIRPFNLVSHGVWYLGYQDTLTGVDDASLTLKVHMDAIEGMTPFELFNGRFAIGRMREISPFREVEYCLLWDMDGEVREIDGFARLTFATESVE